MSGVNLPAWLNEEFVEKIFKHHDANDDKKITNVCVEAATSKGDNYLSEILRVNIEYVEKNSSRKEMSFIIKIPPQQEGLQTKMASLMEFFESETSMMKDTLEKMNNLIGPAHSFNAKLLFSQMTEPVLMVLEDLAPLGYRMADRYAGLDMKHALLAARSLAKFHAASVALCEKEPHQKNIYKRGLFSEMNSPDFETFFINCSRKLADEMATWPEAKQYASKLAALSPRIYKIAIKNGVRKDDEFNVINHGDFWVNNMMFRYDETGNPINHIMVDFQMSYYATPAMDLLYFFGVSLSEDIYLNQKDKVLREYHKMLTATLKKLRCKTKSPSMDELQKSLRERGFIEMIISFSGLPLMLTDKTAIKNMDEMCPSDGEWDFPGIKGELYRKVVVKRLPLFETAGFFDL